MPSSSTLSHQPSPHLLLLSQVRCCLGVSTSAPGAEIPRLLLGVYVWVCVVGGPLEPCMGLAWDSTQDAKRCQSPSKELAQGGILRDLILKPAAPILCCVLSPWGGLSPRGRVSKLYSKLSGSAWEWLGFRGVSPIQPPPPGRDGTMAGSGAPRFVLSAVQTAASSSHHGDRTRRLRAPSSNQAGLRAALPRLPVPLGRGSHPQQ